MKREVYVLVLDRPDKCTVNDMKKHIKDAIQSHAGGYPVTHPLFGWFGFRHGGSVGVTRREPPVINDLAEAVAAGHALHHEGFDSETQTELQARFREVAQDVCNRLELDPRKPV